MESRSRPRFCGEMQSVRMTRCSSGWLGLGWATARTLMASMGSACSTSPCSSTQRRDSKSSSRMLMSEGTQSSPVRSASSVQWKVPRPAMVRSIIELNSSSRPISRTRRTSTPCEAKACSTSGVRCSSSNEASTRLPAHSFGQLEQPGHALTEATAGGGDHLAGEDEDLALACLPRELQRPRLAGAVEPLQEFRKRIAEEVAVEGHG